MTRPVVSGLLITVAIVFFAIGLYTGVHQPPVGPKGVAAVYATIDLECSNKTYTLSSGDNQGSCVVIDGKSGSCTNGKNNEAAAATCDHGCSKTSGGGTCSVKK